MGKTPKVKKRGVSIHSRAARRETSPGIDIDKSLLAVKAPDEDKQSKPKFLGVQDGGISKKKKGKQMSRQQRLRQQKGVERADANIDKLEKKRSASVRKAKTIKGRSVPWEELNGEVEGLENAPTKKAKVADEEPASEEPTDQVEDVPPKVLEQSDTLAEAADVPIPQEADLDQVL